MVVYPSLNLCFFRKAKVTTLWSTSLGGEPVMQLDDNVENNYSRTFGVLGMLRSLSLS